MVADTLTNTLLIKYDARLANFHNNLPINSLKVISWVPCGVKKHDHVGSYKVQAEATCPDVRKRRKSVNSIFRIFCVK